jgi:hypothetical protein
VETNDADRETERFCTKLYTIINKYFPIKHKNISLKRLNMPWIDGSVLRLINMKHKFFLMVKRQTLTYYVFNAYIKLLKVLIDKMRIFYYNTKFKSNKYDRRKHWATINNIIGRDKKSKMVEIEIPNMGVTSDLGEITRSFNEFFQTVPIEVQSNLGPSQNNYINLVKHNNESIFLTPSGPDEIAKIILKLKNKNGLNEIPIRILKHIKNDISKILSVLFNLILESAVYPGCLKLARVVPIYKTGDSKQMTNYRPVSVLSVVNKIFEKLLYVRLNAFFRATNVLSADQFGFTRSRDTQQAALKLIDLTLPSFGTNEISVCVFIDFSKAFDTVDHSLLLRKLDICGIRGVANELFASYLRDRMQYVNLSSVNSETLPMNVGVPQGSVLGPLFFILYSNDLTCLLADDKIVMFADDSTLICNDVCPGTLYLKVENCMYSIIDWCKFNKLSLNYTKTKLMLFSNKKIDFPILSIDGREIEQVETFKYLGFCLDNKLKHNCHIRKITSKMSSLNYVSYKICKLLQHDAAVSFYYGMIHPHLSYGIVVWGGAIIEMRGFDRLNRLQDNIVYNLFSREHEIKHRDLNLIYRRNNVLKVKDLYRYTAGVTMYRVLYCDVANFIFDKLITLLRDHNYLTRNRNSIKLPFPTVRTVKANFLYRMIDVWNQIPNDLKILASLKSFKKMYKTYLLDKY